MDWRVPPVRAERVVDFEAINDHVLRRRAAVERHAWPAARRYAQALDLHEGIPSLRAVNELEARLRASVAQTYRFGYDSVERELRELRDSRDSMRAMPVPDNAGPARDYVERYAWEASRAFSGAMTRYWPKVADDELGRGAKLEAYARRMLHNAVLELVGHVLNAGRTLAALGAERPVLTAAVAPAMWAMRSEQLDTNTCGPCDHVHGTVVQVGSDEYFSFLPPNFCLGRGRCRGVYVYGDSPSDFRRAPGQLRLPEAI